MVGWEQKTTDSPGLENADDLNLPSLDSGFQCLDSSRSGGHPSVVSFIFLGVQFDLGGKSESRAPKHARLPSFRVIIH